MFMYEVVQYIQCVPLCNNALHDFMDDDTFWVLRRIEIFQPYNSGDCWVKDRL